MIFLKLTKAFDLVCRDILYKIFATVCCLPNVLNIVQLFHIQIKYVDQFDGTFSKVFNILSGAKQGRIVHVCNISRVFTPTPDAVRNCLVFKDGSRFRVH